MAGKEFGERLLRSDGRTRRSNIEPAARAAPDASDAQFRRRDGFSLRHRMLKRSLHCVLPALLAIVLAAPPAKARSYIVIDSPTFVPFPLAVKTMQAGGI